jgi:NADH dehydrogenase
VHLAAAELNGEIAELAGQSPLIVDMPDFIASVIAGLDILPGAPLTSDQWIMLQKDNVPTGKCPGFKAFGITPTPMSAVACVTEASALTSFGLRLVS